MAELTRDDYIRKAVWKVLWSIATTVVVPMTRTRVVNYGKVPRRGGILLVANHPSPWDPILVPWSSIRQVHNLGTDQLLRVPYFGWMMPYFSMIPFKKGMRDPEALAELQRRVDNGDAALIFAEGDRSWTGRSLPVKPGIGRMVKRLGVPVAMIRVETGHLHWPRWAKYPRAVPIRLRVVEVEQFSEDATVEEITAYIQARISVDPEQIEVPKRSWGTRLAHGLPDFLWSCPSCFALDGLELDPGDGDRVRCRECDAQWRVDLACWLRGESPGAEDMHVERAYNRVLDHFGELPVASAARHQDTGVVLEGEAKIDRIHFGQVEPERLGLGLLELHDDFLRFTGAEGAVVEIPFAEIATVQMQVGNRLQVRTANDNFQIRPTLHSPNMWKLFIDRHLRHFRTAPAQRRAAQG
ncbi:1-acyl-sn-glycerol-3-phosphate acyltransferase [Pseudenhygromyxa sp. WMMC2535]|uniref:lysophospholipid acyltransferase family protein n=1 Tax=Pseudenhygromyxa sp. WMMC2535 TaxID=2712867 RepID=UPI001553B75E|nr:lysophospholipid acyltransferase family protein [Pseudenhygromyxa sp. WMMC2535]NVB41950.1 1-acyl-sn-glycerol-3-phosphate acyltransferase [Pseudenhygromyxa sp. WMMC2535]